MCDAVLLNIRDLLEGVSLIGESYVQPVWGLFCRIPSWCQSPVPSPTRPGRAVPGTEGGRQRDPTKFTQPTKVQTRMPEYDECHGTEEWPAIPSGEVNSGQISYWRWPECQAFTDG